MRFEDIMQDFLSHNEIYHNNKIKIVHSLTEDLMPRENTKPNIFKSFIGERGVDYTKYNYLVNELITTELTYNLFLQNCAFISRDSIKVKKDLIYSIFYSDKYSIFKDRISGGEAQVFTMERRGAERLTNIFNMYNLEMPSDFTKMQSILIATLI